MRPQPASPPSAWPASSPSASAPTARSPASIRSTRSTTTFSKTFGHHNLKFGYDGRRFNVSNPFNARNSGSFSFNYTTSAYATGDPSLDFLLGIPASYTQGTGADIQADAFLNYFFAQDSWKAHHSLTLNYGLGYSIDTPLRNHQYGGEGIACLTPGEQPRPSSPRAPTGILYPGDPGCHNSGQATTRYSEFGPRFGFAWSPDYGKISGGPGKFSIYGGFGIYYNRSEEETALQTLETPPFGLTSNGAVDYGASAPAFANPYQDLNSTAAFTNKFPFTFPTKGQAVDFTPLEPLGISTYGKGFRAPYSENFQVTVERELPSRMVPRLSYVGSLGRHNQVTYEGNAETAGRPCRLRHGPHLHRQPQQPELLLPQPHAGQRRHQPRFRRTRNHQRRNRRLLRRLQLPRPPGQRPQRPQPRTPVPAQLHLRTLPRRRLKL